MGRHPGAWYDDAERLARTGDWNLTEIGLHFGVSRERVRQVLRDRGIRIDNATGHRIAREHRLGATTEEIVAYANEHGVRAAAEKFGCQKAWIYNLPGLQLSPRSRWFSGILDEELAWMYVEQGWSTNQIARVTGIAQSGVSWRLKCLGLSRPIGTGGEKGGQQSHDPGRAALIRRLIREDRTNREITEEVGVSGATVAYWRRKIS